MNGIKFHFPLEGSRRAETFPADVVYIVKIKEPLQAPQTSHDSLSVHQDPTSISPREQNPTVPNCSPISSPEKNAWQYNQEPPIMKDIEVTLEEILKGCMKPMEFERMSSIGKKEKITLQVPIEQGSQDGDQIVFPKEGDRT